MNTHRAISGVALLCLLAACGGPHCKNSNAIFDQYKMTDDAYKAELVRQLRATDPSAVHYYADKYKEINNKPYMTVYVIADGLCAEMLIDIKNPNKLKHFKNVRGISYSGKEITGLQYFTDTTNGGYNFIFEEGKIGGSK
jgi:hypothetical protein